MNNDFYSFIVSIVVPTYNRQHLIAEAIKSVLDQTFTHWELIIVDDGSTDETEQIVNIFIKNDERIRYVKRPANKPKGANACRNYGLTVSKGKYVKWLDSDDLLAPDCLEKQIAVIQKKEADVNLCFAQFFTNEGGVRFLDRLWCNRLTTKSGTYDLVRGKLKWQTATGLWKKDVLKVNPFNEMLQNSQEWLFNIEMSLFPNLKISTTESNLVFIRSHTGSMSSKLNANGKYYFFSALARYFALELATTNKVTMDIKVLLLRRFLWYQLFSLIKKYPRGFFNLMRHWPRLVYLFLK